MFKDLEKIIMISDKFYNHRTDRYCLFYIFLNLLIECIYSNHSTWPSANREYCTASKCERKRCKITAICGKFFKPGLLLLYPNELIRMFTVNLKISIAKSGRAGLISSKNLAIYQSNLIRYVISFRRK